MASNIAAKRAAKANRRKAIVAQKRRVGVAMATPAGQIARAATAPILHCLLSEELFEVGMGTLVLARGSAGGGGTVAVFLLDAFCLGVKDIIFRTVQAAELRVLLDRLDASSPLAPVDPAYARKLLRDLVQWSGQLGFRPPLEFADAERLFGNVDAAACDVTFAFGREGKPFYVNGPTESPAAVRRRMQHLEERFGQDGFDYMVGGELLA